MQFATFNEIIQLDSNSFTLGPIMPHKVVTYSLSVAAFGLIITSSKAEGTWKITLVYFIHAQDGSLLPLNKKSLYGILNIYILPALFLSTVTEMPKSIVSKLLGCSTVNNLFASTPSSRCVVLPCFSFC